MEADSVVVPPGAEIILISDDESKGDEDEANDTDAPPIAWSKIADRLLTLAKNGTLRCNQEVVATLLRNCHILPSVHVQRSLQATCEELGRLLLFLRDHVRRQRACEDLALVVCEVLSLVQTAPYKLRYGREFWSQKEKAEIRTDCAMDIAYQLMDRWGVFVVQCARSSDGRSFAIGSTMSRLETMIAKCSSDIVRLHSFMLKYEQEMKSAAEEWVEMMKKCRRDLEPQWVNTNERDWKVYDDTFNQNEAVRKKFEANNKARKSLMHYVQEQELRSKFYRATLRLLCVATQPMSVQTQQENRRLMAYEESIYVLGNDLLEHLDTFCGALEDVMAPSLRYHGDLTGRADVFGDMAAARTRDHVDRLDLINFAKNVKAFWLIHRNWLPEGVLDMVIRRFGTMSAANMHERLSEQNATSVCPLRSAISRVCVGLQAGW